MIMDNILWKMPMHIYVYYMIVKYEKISNKRLTISKRSKVMIMIMMMMVLLVVLVYFFWIILIIIMKKKIINAI